jgi:hypothetical protein
MHEMLIKLGYPANKRVPHIIILTTYVSYVALFALYHHNIGNGIAALAALPVIGAGWYFGVKGGVLTAVLSTLANTAIFVFEGHSNAGLLYSPGNWIGTFVLILTGLVVGSLGTVTRQRRAAIFKLEQYEQDQKAHTHFLESLNETTAVALEADNLGATFNILCERILTVGRNETSTHSHCCIWLSQRYLSLCTI